MFSYLVSMLAVSVVVGVVLLLWPWSGIIVGVAIVALTAAAMRPVFRHR